MPLLILHADKTVGPFSLSTIDKKTSEIKLPPEALGLIAGGDKVQIEPLAWIFKRATEAYKAKNFDAALADFLKVSKKIFCHEPSLYNLGLCYFSKTKYTEAQKAFEEANQCNPYNLFTYKFIADLHLLINKYTEAEKKLKEIVQRNQQDIDAHLKLGLLAIEKNDLDSATEEFTFVRNLSAQDLVSRLNLSGIFIQKKDFVKAKEYLDEAETKTFSDAQSNAFSWSLQGYLRAIANETREAQIAISMAQALAPDWKALKEPIPLLPKLQQELAEYLLKINSSQGLFTAELLGFAQSEAAQRAVTRLLKEKEAEKTIAQKAPQKRPFDLTGELNQTFEYYDRKPGTSNPINDLNTITNLKLESKVKDVRLKMEFEGYYNRWDHTELDYYKVNAKDNKDNEIDAGKFSAKNFPELVSHPTIEGGFRWWHRFQRAETSENSANLPQNLEGFTPGENKEQIPSLAEIYSADYIDRGLFKTLEITLLSGRSKRPRNLNRPKPKNDMTYETSGQFEQWVNAFHLMTKPTDISQLGFSYSRVKDDELSATVSSTTFPLESETVGMDEKIELLDGKLKTDGEFAWSNYDTNLFSEVKNKQDKAFSTGADYKLNPNWDFSYDLKRIGTNFKVEGAYQTEDKITQTWTTKYSQSKNTPWSVRSIDIKYEPSHTNLPKSGTTTTTYYKTLQPKISFNLAQEAKLSFDYKWYLEDSTCKCTYYRTTTLKTDAEYECKPIQTTFKPSYTFERKDDRVNSPTDEKKKDYGVSLENKSINNLNLKFSWEREMKTYVGANTKAYDNKKYSLEAKYTFIPNRFASTFKASMDDKAQTDTNDIQLDILDFVLDYTSKDGNRKLVLEYERKYNIYEPWSDTSAYRQHYTKIKYTQKF